MNKLSIEQHLRSLSPLENASRIAGGLLLMTALASCAAGPENTQNVPAATKAITTPTLIPESTPSPIFITTQLEPTQRENMNQFPDADLIEPKFPPKTVDGKTRLYMQVLRKDGKSVDGTCRIQVLLKTGQTLDGWEKPCANVNDSSIDGPIELKPEEFQDGGPFAAQEIYLLIRREGGWPLALRIRITDDILKPKKK